MWVYGMNIEMVIVMVSLKPTVPSQGISSVVPAFCITFRYEASESSLANPRRTCLAVLLSHVRGRFVIFGDKRVVTIADVEEKLFSLRHALYRQSAFITPRTVRNSNLRRINPKLVFLHSLVYIVEPVVSSELTTSILSDR